MYVDPGEEKRGCSAVDLDYGCFNSTNDGDRFPVMGVGVPMDALGQRTVVSASHGPNGHGSVSNQLMWISVN